MSSAAGKNLRGHSVFCNSVLLLAKAEWRSTLFLCNKPSCRKCACTNFYMTANVHRAVRRDDITCMSSRSQPTRLIIEELRIIQIELKKRMFQMECRGKKDFFLIGAKSL